MRVLYQLSPMYVTKPVWLHRAPPGTINLGTGYPAPTLLPNDLMSSACVDAAARLADGSINLSYGPRAGQVVPSFSLPYSISHYSPPITHNLPPTSHSLLPISHNLPPISHYLPPISHRSPRISHQSPPISHYSPPIVILLESFTRFHIDLLIPSIFPALNLVIS